MLYSTTFIFRLLLATLLGLVSLARLPAQAYRWSTFAGSTDGSGFQDGPVGFARFKSARSVASDEAGNTYLTDTGNHTIRIISRNGIFTTLAGKAGINGSLDGRGNLAKFNSPGGIAVDSMGTVYVADTGNHTIRKITSSGVVTTLAGVAGGSGHSDGTGNAARFFSPMAITLAKNGNLFVADSGNHQIRMITPDGVVTTVAGKAGIPGSTDGSTDIALFRGPRALTTDGEGSIYVADTFNRVIRKITAEGNVTTLAGLAGASGGVDAVGSAARFSLPEGILVNSAKEVFVADSRSIRVIAAVDASVSTLAGQFGKTGSDDGTGSAARFTRPTGMTMSSDGALIVADSGGQTLRKITLTGVVTTLAANSTAVAGDTDSLGTNARFRNPLGLCVDNEGIVYVADTGNQTIRKISPSGVVSTFAGAAGQSGITDANGPSARFTSPRAVTFGPDGVAYVADVVSTYDSTIRKITSDGAVTTLAATSGSMGPGDTLYLLSGLAVNSAGEIFASDVNSIRKITPQGVASIFAGQQRQSAVFQDGNFTLIWKVSGPPDGFGNEAIFRRPSGLAIDARGNLFITDSGASVIRKVTPSREATTLAGYYQDINSLPGSDDGTSTAARFNGPNGCAVDASGNVYIADSGNHTIRRMSPAGVVTTIGGIPGYVGSVEGIGESSAFNKPQGVAVDSAGNLYVADTSNNRIVKGVPLLFPEIVVQNPDGKHLMSGGIGLEFTSTAPATASSSKILTIHNTGSASLMINNVLLTGDRPAAFLINRALLPTEIPPNGSGQIEVTFMPDTVGAVSSTLRILSDDADESLIEVIVRGMGNHPPVFNHYAISSPVLPLVRIPIAKLLSSVSDPDGDIITVTSASWPNISGGGLVVEKDSILFSPLLTNFMGTTTFLVELTDTRGGSVFGDVRVTWQSSATTDSMARNPAKLVMMQNGSVNVSFHGIPGRSYMIQRSLTLRSWENIRSVSADSTGRVIYIDPSPPKPSAFYRIAIP